MTNLNLNLEQRAQIVSKAKQLGLVPPVGNPDRGRIVARLHEIDMATFNVAVGIYELARAVEFEVEFFDLIKLDTEAARKLRKQLNGRKGAKTRQANAQRKLAEAQQTEVELSTQQAKMDFEADRAYRYGLWAKARALGIPQERFALVLKVCNSGYSPAEDYLAQRQAEFAVREAARKAGIAQTSIEAILAEGGIAALETKIAEIRFKQTATARKGDGLKTRVGATTVGMVGSKGATYGGGSSRKAKQAARKRARQAA